MREISYWLLCGTDFCLFIYSLSCLFKQSSKSFSSRLLGTMLFILAWYVFISLLILSGNLIGYAFLFRVGVPFYYLLIPLMYCYLFLMPLKAKSMEIELYLKSPMEVVDMGREEVIPFPEHHEAPADLKHYTAELEKLENLMVKFQAFRRKGLTLQDIAIELGIASYVLSAILNNYYHQHFNDYINTYRISYVIERIRSDKDWKKLSIEGLADEAGFASRTPFYAAFKKHTGLTPSAYIQQHRV